MTSISLANYYPLSGTQTGSGSTAGSSSSLSLTQSLVSDLDSVDSSGSGTAGADAYSLNLSQQAQSLLNGGASSSSANFTLTSAQQTTISNILEKYKNAPFTQATFNEIQDDLQSAGVSADQLIAQDETSSFNPTDDLINALNGNYNVTTPATTASSEQTKASNYLQSIVKEWQSISTTASASSASGSTSLTA